MTGVVFAHDALEFWEFAHHERTEIGLREERGAFGVSAVCTDQIGELARHRLHAQHALGLRAKLVVVDDMLETFDAAFERFAAVLIIEELGVRKTGSHDAGIPRGDRRTAVLRFELRNEEELVHQTTRRIAQR